MNPVLATTRNDQLLLAAVLAAGAAVFVLAGSISAWLGRRKRRGASATGAGDGAEAASGAATAPTDSA